MSIDNYENVVKSKDFVQSLARGMEVIQSFSEDNPEQTISQITDKTGISRPSVRRMLITLLHLGFVKSDNGVYSLTPRVLTLGFAYLSSNIWSSTQSIMREFVSKTGESCSISVLDDTDIIYVARVPAKRIMSINLNIGSKLPALVTSMGHVLLANLPDKELNNILNKAQIKRYTDKTILNKDELLQTLNEVKLQGWACVEQQLEEGLRSIAIPLKNHNGEIIAAMNCSVHAGRVSREKLIENFLPLLIKTGENISKTIP